MQQGAIRALRARSGFQDTTVRLPFRGVASTNLSQVHPPRLVSPTVICIFIVVVGVLLILHT